MSFASVVQTDFRTVLLDTDEFAETVVYTPSGGSPISIAASIDRERALPGLNLTGGRPSGMKTRRVIILNQATYGVTTVKEGFDTMAVKMNLDDTGTTTCRVTKIVDQSLAHWDVEVEA